MAISPISLIISCEHASNKIPAEFEQLYVSSQEKLLTHYGYDLYAKSIYDVLTKTFNCSHQAGETSRLLIDLNRTLDHKNSFSTITRPLNQKTKNKIIQNYYLPYFNQLQCWVSDGVANNHSVLHLSIHTFTPILNGKTRSTDIGLLYDPLHNEERKFCHQWRKEIESITDNFKVKMNYPYYGKTNGLTAHFRKNYSSTQYRGIEVEVNQTLFETTALAQQLMTVLKDSLQSLLAPHSQS